MSRARTVRINGSKLKEAINKKGLTPVDVSRIVDKSDSYIRDMCRRGVIAQNVVLLLNERLGIDPSLYVIEDDAEPEADGKMIRNINVEFISFKLKELGISHAAFCKRMNKQDNYFGNMKANGMAKGDLKEAAKFLGLSENDKRLIKEDTTLTEETETKVKTEMHKIKSDFAIMKTRIKELEHRCDEYERRIEGINRINSNIVGALHNNHIFVGKN